MNFLVFLGCMFVAFAVFKFVKSLWGGKLPDRSSSAPGNYPYGGGDGVHH